MKTVLLTVTGVGFGVGCVLFSIRDSKKNQGILQSPQSQQSQSLHIDGELLEKLRFACLEENKPIYVFDESEIDDVDCELVGFKGRLNLLKERAFLNMEIVQSEYPLCKITVDFKVNEIERQMFPATEVISFFTIEDVQ